MTNERTNERTNDNSDFVYVRQATREGKIKLFFAKGGVFDASYPTSKLRRGRVQGDGGISPTVTTGGNAIHKIYRGIDMEEQKKGKRYRIRKLTPRECFRLMNVNEKDFESAQKTVSNSQLYKIAGNSIVVACMVATFSQLGIQGIKKWNDMTDDERYKLIYKGCCLEEKV